MPSIVHIISSLHRGGRERQAATIVANTDIDKYHTVIIYFNESADNYIDEYDLNHYVKKIVSDSLWGRLVELNRHLKEIDPDLVYTWGILESILVAILNPFFRFTFVNGSIRHGIRSRKFNHYFRTVLLHLSRNIVANSYAGLRANNLNRGFVLYNGIDEKFIASLEDRAARQRDIINISEEIPVFISVANLSPYKDYKTAIRAFKKIKNNDMAFHYLILGDGPLRKNTTDFIRECGLSEHVTIVGVVENVNEYLKIADVFIHSSKGEGCSNAILEAMAAGLPVVASKTGGTPEIVSRENGFLFEYQNTEELYDLLLYCMKNRDACRKMGTKSSSIIKERFSIDSMMNNYYQIINAILKN